MHPKEKIQQDLKAAMKSGDVPRREALRLVMAAFKQVEVDKRIELSESDVVDILMTEVKKRREAIQDMERAGRTDLVAQEQFALKVIEEYMPKQLSREDVEKLAREVIQETGAASPKDIGNVMKVLMPRVKGQADGKMVNAIVQEILR
jgi:uncharacterized protein YqeY